MYFWSVRYPKIKYEAQLPLGKMSVRFLGEICRTPWSFRLLIVDLKKYLEEALFSACILSQSLVSTCLIAFFSQVNNLNFAQFQRGKCWFGFWEKFIGFRDPSDYCRSSLKMFGGSFIYYGWQVDRARPGHGLCLARTCRDRRGTTCRAGCWLGLGPPGTCCARAEACRHIFFNFLKKY